MSEPENLNGVIADPFQARFGVPAGTQAPEAERRQWELLCRELLHEREQLRTELAETKAKCDRLLIYLQAESMDVYVPTPEEVLALVEQQPSIEELIAELEREHVSGSPKPETPDTK